MMKSMTGFGRYELSDQNRKFIVEIKSVNHRYLDLNIKMPKKLNLFEGEIRSFLKNKIMRGKVDVFISYEDTSAQAISVKYNSHVAAEYVANIRKMAEEFNLGNDLSASSLSRYPEVLVMEEQGVDEEGLWNTLKQTLEGAIESFVLTREKEGMTLQNDLLEKLEGMLVNIKILQKRTPDIVTEYRFRLEEKIRELLQDARVDENRLIMETTIFADKVCIDEEIVRLKSHIEHTKETLIQGGCVGRKLDFIAQEMNREANTILSKATDIELSNCAIELKTEIEKVREQIQNLE
ncbi:MAG: YicC/YloC family endoribonuclease [Lachnospiraceae bacterium]